MSDNNKNQTPTKKSCDRCDDLELKCLDLEAAKAELLKRVAEMRAAADKVEERVTAKYEQKLIDLQKTFVEGKAVEPYYKIQAVTPRGSFWAIGRQFKNEPTKILVKDLKPEEILSLGKVLPQHLAVTKVTHE